MSRLWMSVVVLAVVAMLPLQALAQTPTPTPTPTPSLSPSPTPVPVTSPSPTPVPAPSPTASPTPTPVPLIVDDDEPNAGQYVVVKGTGCLAGEPVFFGLDRERLEPTIQADPRGAFQAVVQIPPDTVPQVQYTLFAVCGNRAFSVAVTVGVQFQGELGVSDTTPSPGDTVTLVGAGCQPDSVVTFFLDTTPLKPDGRANGFTAFKNDVTIPRGIRARTYTVSARCGPHALVAQVQVQGGQVGQVPGGGVQTGLAAVGRGTRTAGVVPPAAALLLVGVVAVPRVRRRVRAAVRRGD